MNCVSFSCSSWHRALSENSMPFLRQRPCRARRPGRASASRLGSRRTVRRGRTPPGCGPGQDFLVVERLAGVLAAELFLAVGLAVVAGDRAEPLAFLAVDRAVPLAFLAVDRAEPAALVAVDRAVPVAFLAVDRAVPVAFLAPAAAFVPAARVLLAALPGAAFAERAVAFPTGVAFATVLLAARTAFRSTFWAVPTARPALRAAFTAAASAA